MGTTAIHTQSAFRVTSEAWNGVELSSPEANGNRLFGGFPVPRVLVLHHKKIAMSAPTLNRIPLVGSVGALRHTTGHPSSDPATGQLGRQTLSELNASHRSDDHMHIKLDATENEMRETPTHGVQGIPTTATRKRRSAPQSGRVSDTSAVNLGIIVVYAYCEPDMSV